MFSMLNSFYQIYYLDIWIIIIGILSASSCAIPGNFLILKRMSMMGDAISHAVLPGLAIAFLLTGTRNSIPMFIGAAVVGLLTVVLTQSINIFGRVDKSAAMGVVFSILFALGLILIVKGADHVDLDPGCVLYGSIELSPLNSIKIAGFDIPKAALSLAIVFLLNLSFVIIFFKELKISSFDPALSTTLGINSNIIYYILMALVAVSTVASFESVGSILVIAMIIVPGAISFILTNSLKKMIILSVITASICAIAGHISAITIPPLFGFSDTNTSGMMAVTGGVIFLLALIFTPNRGIVSRLVNQAKLSMQITNEDILGMIFRIQNLGDIESAKLIHDFLNKTKGTNKFITLISMQFLKIKHLIVKSGKSFKLTENGMNKAKKILRSHRLWESYIFKYITANPERLHFSAHQLEHVTDLGMLKQLMQKTGNPENDPHGKAIPKLNGQDKDHD